MKSIILVLLLSSIVLILGLGNLSNAQGQLSNQTQFLPPIKIAKNGAHGADLFIDPKTNYIYIAYIQTQNKSTNLYFTKSIDNGQNFSKPIRVNDKTNDVMWDGRVPPQIKVTNNGTIYTLYVSTKDVPDLCTGLEH